MLLHAALVGAAAGIAGALFFGGLEIVEKWVLEDLAGYVPLRAQGEGFMDTPTTTPFRPWLLWAVPAIGATLGGLLSARLAPETRGGGSDAIIDAFHNHGGVVRRRVPLVKAFASMLTLGFGGSGGREGPTMQIGGALGSLVGRTLRVTDRERRILLVAGTAAGMAAVFRTPLGAALLAVEVLHRDDFESDALVPSVLASVVSYSVFLSIYSGSFSGDSKLFAHAEHYPFVPAHLPLYALMAVLVSFVASVFLTTLDGVKRLSARMTKIPDWVKPGVGGLLLGGMTVPFLLFVGPLIGRGGEGLGLLGGGYGAAQLAITGAPWFKVEGWSCVELLLLLGALKIVATSLTVGSGGSAGDFGPSLVIGGIFGGAFGRIAQLLLHDPRIDPGAFALVGMGTFYGGLAHVPIASLVMVCELAGSYDLLVPLMLAEGIAFVALRHRSLYHAQVATRRDSPAHRDDLIFDVLRGVKVGEVVLRDRPYVSFTRKTPASDVLRDIAASGWQDAFPVLGEDGTLAGIISADILRTMATDPEVAGLTLADDLMTAPSSVRDTDDLHVALEQILAHNVRELLVVDEGGRIVGFLDEADITRVYHSATSK
jgi:CIC family chloride channel protein